MPDRPNNSTEAILEAKRAEVEARRASMPIERLQELISELGRPRNLFAACTRHPHGLHTSVIAEITRKTIAGDGAGERGEWLRPEYAGEDFDPARIATAYAAAGAAALCVPTDGPMLGGRIEDIHRVRDAVRLPVLRRDFIIDPWQVWETRAAGADAMLLVAELLMEGEIIDLLILAEQLRLTTVVMARDMDSLLRVRPHIGFPHRSYCLLGIDNRDPITGEADINATLRMVDLVDDRSVLVSEGGIRTPEDLRRLRSEDVRIAMAGETLMREPDPGSALRRLLA